MVKNVIKRDGRRRKFNPSKIEGAIKNAFIDKGITVDDTVLDTLTDKVVAEFENYEKSAVSVEKIQDVVEKVLMTHDKDVAKSYILFRNERNRVRNTKSEIVKTIKEIKESDISSSNILRDNANESGATPAGAFGKVASETNKMYNLLNVIDRRHADMHSKGYMHIHDLNYYDLSFNCLFAPIDKLLGRGFDSGTGFIRQPKSIQTAAQLTAVILQLQSNQQYGGIASDNLDFTLAPYVDFSFCRNLAKELAAAERYSNPEWANLENYDKEAHEKKILNETINAQHTSINEPKQNLYKRFNKVSVDAAISQTNKDTFQAMEGLIHNLNSLQSRSGNQVPFSSLNFGLDTSKAGRMVSGNLIRAQMAGLGDGLTAIFPILIFKLMKGVSYLPTDPNHDLYLASIKCLARRFYPNFVGVDNKFNAKYIKYDTIDYDLTDDAEVKVIGSDVVTTWGEVKNETHEYPKYETRIGLHYWQIDNGKLRRLKPETTVATMGCRTRVIGNVNGPEQTTGRGNFAFHTLNLPKLAIQAHIEANTEEERIALFNSKFDALLEDAKKSLLDRFALISKKTYENFPFTMQQGLYLTADDEQHNIHDTIAEVLKQSTLSIGYCGLYEAILCLTGKTWGKDSEVFDLGYSIVKKIYDFCKKTEKETHLNWSCFATPAEATAGRFCNIDKNLYGGNEKLADIDEFQLFGKGYYTNSHMIPFDLKTNLANKIKWEQPFHEITTAGHIFYHKIDGDLSQNIDAVKKCIDTMYENGLGYFTVTMDSDTCIHEDEKGNRCGFHGVINGVCPKCGCSCEDEFVRVRRITGYLTGSPRKSITKAWNDGKLHELENRVNI